MALLGAILPVIATRLHISVGRAGTAFSALGAGMLVGGLIAGPIIDRWGARIPMIAGPAVTAAAVWGLAGATTFKSLLACVALLGLGGGVINNVSNAVVASLYHDPKRKASALNLLGTMFGVGALTLPFAIGTLLETAGFGPILRTTAAASAAIAVLGGLPRYTKAAQAEFSGATALRLLREPYLLALGASLFLQSGNEFVLSGFITTYLTTIFGVSVRTASLMLAVYWTCVLISRLLVSRASLRFTGPTIVTTGATGSAVGVALLALAPGLPSALAGIVLLGFCISAIFPTTLGIAGARFPATLGTAFGILFGVSLAGGMIVPPMFGAISGRAGLRLALAMPCVAFCGIASIHFLSRINEKMSSNS
jgi:fucose permease